MNTVIIDRLLIEAARANGQEECASGAAPVAATGYGWEWEWQCVAPLIWSDAQMDMLQYHSTNAARDVFTKALAAFNEAWPAPYNPTEG